MLHFRVLALLHIIVFTNPVKDSHKDRSFHSPSVDFNIFLYIFNHIVIKNTCLNLILWRFYAEGDKSPRVSLYILCDPILNCITVELQSAEQGGEWHTTHYSPIFFFKVAKEAAFHEPGYRYVTVSTAHTARASSVAFWPSPSCFKTRSGPRAMCI